MQDILAFLILIVLIEDPLVIAFHFTDCEILAPLKECPDFDSSKWKDRAFCKNCADGTKYHCCKDYDSPKLTCEQGDYYCEKEIFVEGCAEESFCKKGEEPVLNFVKNQRRTDKPEVLCVKCYNNNRYNSFDNKSSATYSECPRKKQNICTPATHKVECNKSDETDERYCRCDVRNGYYPYSHAHDHPTNGCSFDPYECVNDPPKCKPNEQLLLNYTCETLENYCEEGFYIPEHSDDCIPIPTTEITQETKTSTISSSEAYKTTSPPAITAQSTIPKRKSTTIISTSKGNEKLIYPITISCGVLLALAVLLSFVAHKRGWCKRRNERGQPGRHSDTEKGRYNFSRKLLADGPEQAQDPTNPTVSTSDAGPPVVNYNVYNVKHMINTSNTDGLTINIPETADTDESETDGNTSFTSRSRASTSASKQSKPEKGFLATSLISGRETKSIPDFLGKETNKYSLPTETHSLDRRQKPCLQKVFGGSETKMKIPKDVKDLYSLSDEEYKAFVTTVLRLCYGEMIGYLNPVPVLDIFTRRNIFTITVITDIREEKKTSNKIRELLKRLREKGTVCYMQFKEALLESKQDACFNELEKQEIYAYQELIDIRKKSLYPESDHLEGQFTEIDEIAPSRPLSEDHKIISSSIGFDPTGNCCDVEQNKNGNWGQKKEKYPIKDEQFAAEAGDVQQQEMEDQAKKYLQRLNDTAGDFCTFEEEVDLVKEDIDKRCPHLLTCPNETLTKLECPEEENSPEGFQAYKSSGISNSCLYQSVSMLLRGDEQLQHRLRLKTTLHCCKAFSRYMKGLEVHFQHEQIDTIKQFFYYVSAETWERISDMTEKEKIIKESLKALITETACIGTDSSRLHVQFLSDALGRKIEEHFQLKHHFGETKTVIPLEQIEDALGKESLHVYWIDMTGKGKKMNHIVPLLRNS